MSNITRIKNNQVTDNTIEYQKLKDGTLVGSKFNANLTLNSNVTILGNLTVANSFAQLNSINTYINDPIVVFNNNYTGSPTYDIGMLINRNLSSLAPYGAVNAAFVWKEADNAFVAVMTTETGTTAGAINNTGWANLKVGNVTAFSTTSGLMSAAAINNTIIGNITPAAATITQLNTTGVFYAGGNIVANSGTASTTVNTGALVVNGGAGIDGAVNIGTSLTVDGGAYGNVVTTQYGSVFASANGSNNYSIMQVWSQGTQGIGMDAFGTELYSSGALNFKTGATIRDKDYPTGGTLGSQFAANGAIIALTNITSTDTGTGALIVRGGVGISGDVYASSLHTPQAEFTTLVATDFSTSNLNAFVGNVTTMYAQDFSASNVLVNGDTVINGNLSVTGALVYLDTTIEIITGIEVVAGNLIANSGIESTNTTTGALVVEGGIGVSGKIIAGGNVVIASDTHSEDKTTGALVITGDGGIGVGGNIHAGTYDTSLHNIQGNLLLGKGTDQANDSALTINLNDETPLPSSATLHMSGTLNKLTYFAADSFGSGHSGIILRKANGTPAAPTAAQADDILGSMVARGYGTTTYNGGSQSSVQISATENFTDSAQGTVVRINAVPNGAVTPVRGLEVFGNGSVIVPGVVTSTTPYDGALIVAGGAGIAGNVVVGGQIDVNGISLFEQRATFAGNLVANSSVNSESIDTGAVVVVGGLGVYSNVTIGGATIFNANSETNFDTIIQGNNTTHLLWARAGVDYDQVMIGNSATTGDLVRGAKLIINTTDSILLPVGTNAQRPGNSGGTDVTGMFRYNTTANGLEYFNDTEWTAITTQFTVIVDEQFNGDGVTLEFEMSGASTTASTIISINGVMQIPTIAYAITGAENTTLTFTEAPADGDLIDVRRLATTQTVFGISSTNGYMQVQTDNNGVYIYTGTSGTLPTTSWIATGQEVSNSANVIVNSPNVATTIDSMDNTKYRSAQYFIQIGHGSDFQSQTITLLQDGGAEVHYESHGVLYTAGNLGVVDAVLNGSTSELKFIASNPDTIVKVRATYMTL